MTSNMSASTGRCRCESVCAGACACVCLCLCVAGPVNWWIGLRLKLLKQVVGKLSNCTWLAVLRNSCMYCTNNTWDA